MYGICVYHLEGGPGNRHMTGCLILHGCQVAAPPTARPAYGFQLRRGSSSYTRSSDVFRVPLMEAPCSVEMAPAWELGGWTRKPSLTPQQPYGQKLAVPQCQWGKEEDGTDCHRASSANQAPRRLTWFRPHYNHRRLFNR